MSKNLDTIKLSEMLKSKRGAKGLRAIATEIGGLSAPTLSRIEQGNLPDIDTFLKICKWLEVSPDFFTIHDSTLSTHNQVVAHLRADRILSSETAEALIRMINLAYESSKSK
jgi:transcriptional regulator with XRE-family HTH domain